MHIKRHSLLAGVAVALLLGGPRADEPALAGGKKEMGKEADSAAIRKLASDFIKAFDKHDAKALAALWTDEGEYHHEGGDLVRGRTDIENAFAHLFKEKKGVKIELLIESIRFPARDLAIEEGIVRTWGAESELPATTAYNVTHIRDGGQWKIAVAREWGAGQHRLQDLDWLVGNWRGGQKDVEVTLSFTKNDKKPFLMGDFVKKEKGKVTYSGTMKIGIDPARGQLRSWHFDDDGGHGQALWLRDGNRWVLDSIGVLAGGAETASVNILGRVNGDAFTWRSIDRVMGDEKLPDTPPIKLSRVK